MNSTSEIQAPLLSRLPATAILSEEVVSAQGQRVGFIKELMIDVRAGGVAYAVLSVGGLFGLGSRLYAVPWHALERRAHRFVLSDSLSDAQALDDLDGDNDPEVWLPPQGSPEAPPTHDGKS